MRFRRAKEWAAAEMPFLEHLEELRWRILWSVAALTVGTVIGFLLVSQFNVLGLLARPIEPFLDGDKLKYLSPADPFFLTLKLALIVGILLALPIVVHNVWAFVSPALLPAEKRAIVPALYLGTVLFAAGAALAYFVVLPLTLSFMMGFQVDAMEAAIIANAYLSFVIKLLLAFGIAFELPVVMLVLSAVGLVDAGSLARNRRFAIAGSVILAALLTPGDVLSTILLMGPLILLYEFSIALMRIAERRRRTEESEAQRAPDGAEPAEVS